MIKVFTVQALRPIHGDYMALKICHRQMGPIIKQDFRVAKLAGPELLAKLVMLWPDHFLG